MRLYRLETQPSIHCQNLSGDELRRGGEEENGGGDFVIPAVALHAAD